jgi:hypothetical protein
MGGWASWLLGLLMPDKWAASNPEDGLLVPGLWLGTGVPPVDAQDGADLNSEFLTNIIGNASNLPYAILHGTEDELVPVTSAISAAAMLHQAGFQYRLYTFHAYEHYSAPIWDDWRDVVHYMTQFRRNADPAHVTYSVWPALDHAVSTVSAPAGVDLGLKFNSAYWVSGLESRDGGIGSIDATSNGIASPQTIDVPEAGTAAQPEPYTMIGQRWLTTGFGATSNSFSATLTDLASGTLDLARMSIGTSAPITATITTDGPCDLLLAGTWSYDPSVAGAAHTFDSNGVTLHLPAGTHTVTIGS